MERKKDLNDAKHNFMANIDQTLKYKFNRNMQINEVVLHLSSHKFLDARTLIQNVTKTWMMVKLNTAK